MPALLSSSKDNPQFQALGRSVGQGTKMSGYLNIAVLRKTAAGAQRRIRNETIFEYALDSKTA